MMDIPALAFPLGRTDLKGFNDIAAMVSQNFPTSVAGVAESVFIGVMNLAERGTGFNACSPGVQDGAGGAVIY